MGVLYKYFSGKFPELALTFCSLSNKDSLEKIEETLILLNVFDKIDFPFMSLSYGERKKISIARALLRNVPIILMDEPTSSLDTKTSKKLMKNLIKYSSGKSISLIVVSHDTAIFPFFNNKINL